LAEPAGLARLVGGWYAGNARDLPWRRPGAGAWAVLVSEVMLQQTQVARVLPVYGEFVRRWPTPAALAEATPAEVLRAWGTLGYPRRALWLREAAATIRDRHDGQVPAELDDLLALKGVGGYTARAVASFAYGRRHPVVDANVRRVLTRVRLGRAGSGPPSPAADHALAEPVMPVQPAAAARFAVAVMELGALVCTARAPRCGDCPLAGCCRWNRTGRPAGAPGGRAPAYAGSDRQARGRLLASLRAASGPLTATRLLAGWPEQEQAERALTGLLADGLAARHPAGGIALP